MNVVVPRTCTVILPTREGDRQTFPSKQDSRPLSSFREHKAYVLLGDPGAGKTTAFELEAKVLGKRARLVSAREFITLGNPESVGDGEVLFVDGLDEVRTGGDDPRPKLDEIRRRLNDLGRCLLYTSPSPRDRTRSRMPSSA